jgi:Na+-transporting NADH:ubiquinone oxidoreductase subunit NqrC
LTSQYRQNKKYDVYNKIMKELQQTNNEITLPRQGLGQGLNVVDAMYDFLAIKDKTIIVNGVEVQVDRLSFIMDYTTRNVISQEYEESTEFDEVTGEMVTNRELKTEVDKTLLNFMTKVLQLKQKEANAEESNNKMDQLIHALQSKKTKNIVPEYEVVDD